MRYTMVKTLYSTLYVLSHFLSLCLECLYLVFLQDLCPWTVRPVGPVGRVEAERSNSKLILVLDFLMCYV